MDATTTDTNQAVFQLLDLARLTRQARELSELRFICVNDTHRLSHYRQAALWMSESDICALSGVVQIEANVPYVQWLQQVCRQLHASTKTTQATGLARRISASDVAPAQAEEWAEWLPAEALWLNLPDSDGGLLLARDTPWLDHEMALLSEWISIWSHAWQAKQNHQPLSLRGLVRQASEYFSLQPALPWWRQKRHWWVAAALLVLCIPTRLTVLATGELVPLEPAMIRAPMDGVLANFAVRPNETVKAGQVLFSYDQASLQSRLEVARQTLSTAEAEYRQAAQLAVSDPRYKAQLASLTGKIEERQTEAEFLQNMLTRANVVAPKDGIALFDDPSEWLGKPVTTGERIMRIAEPEQMEVEAWLPIGDAIPIEPGAPVTLHLNASPLFPVHAELRYMAFEATARPDGNYAYRVRAKIIDKTTHRVGLKGSAKLRGHWVPLIYWIARRPLAAIRQMTGW